MSLKTSAMKIFTLLFCFLASSFQMFAGGGWNTGKGKGYFKFGQSIIVADRFSPQRVTSFQSLPSGNIFHMVMQSMESRIDWT